MPTTSDTSARSSRAGRSGSALVTQDSANNINSGTMHGHTAVLGEANEQTYNSSHGRRNQPQRELHLAKDAGSDVTAEIPGPYRQATLSELLLLNSSYAWAGVQDSFAWPIALFVVYGSTTLATKMMQCLFLNGLLFLGSVLAFDYVVSPLAKLGMEVFCRSLSISYDIEAIIRRLGTVLHVIYYVAWIYPLYAFSFFVSSRWYQDIANRSYEIFVGKPQAQIVSIPKLIKNVVSDAYRGLLVFNFIVQVSLIYQLPLVGPVASFILSNFIFAFFAFEYKWINRKWSLSQQVDFFELHWAYFSGFGRVNLANPCMFLFWYLLMTQYIIMANRAKPIPTRKDTLQLRLAPTKLPVFFLAQQTNTLIMYWVKRRRDAILNSSSVTTPDETLESPAPADNIQ
ncbi:hypothetical protein BASA50_008618 [Batrachochytrium salamandrivorans]|uniref:TLC domain-containing protein n=1 Tax=Batrachochytrium salamandrivorans TaxID=1357716 RepID=A0ABQ8F3T5_9FUNG|nr:hypothetical protein BASA60_004476 [Batrachochytrium salamandrivorans]KAH6591645.1 hypothetical protein BASA50_008618 [Batrachochytrium salamandrivorans]